MTGPLDPLIGDTDRERAYQELAEHLGAGRLSLAEFDVRTAAATEAATVSDLAHLFVDLPGAPATRAALRRGEGMRWIAMALVVIGAFATVVGLAVDAWVWVPALLLTAAAGIGVRLR